MNFILFNLFSTIEGLGLITTMLTIYRFNVLNYWKQALFCSIFLSLISYLMRIYLDLAYIVPFTLILLLALFMRFLFDIGIFYTILMVVTGFLAYTLLESLFISLVTLFGIFSFEDMVQPERMEAYSLQLLTSLFAVYFCYLLYKKGWGFSFSFQPTVHTTRSKSVSALVILSVVLIEFAYFSFKKNNIDFYLSSLLLIIAALLVLLTMLINKERKHD